MFKKIILFTMCLTLVCAVFSPLFIHAPKASAAADDPDATKNYFQYDVYEAGGYYEINWYLDIYKDTADAINSVYSDTSLAGKTGVNKVFDSIEQFFYAYEKLFFNNAHAKIMRDKNVAAFDSASNPYYTLNMYIYFASDAEDGGMKAGEKYREYFGYGTGVPMEPTKKTFFADYYETQDITHFYVPDGLPEPGYFRSADYNFESVRQFASLNAIMLPFLIYGNDSDGDYPNCNNGFADKPAAKINYKGLANIFNRYNFGRDRLNIFENYVLYHTLSTSTAYIKTDAKDNGAKHKNTDEYISEWRVSYGIENNPAGKYYSNRDISITYIEPKTINMYWLAIIIAVGFIGIMAGLLYGIPYFMKKKGMKI